MRRHFLSRARPFARPTAAARGAFTLIELLVVMMILGILTSIGMVALWGSMEEARAARTRAQIQKINELLMIKWESYRTRPAPIKTGKLPPELAAKARLNALRQLMRMELPDRITDVNDDPGPVLELPNGQVVATMGTPALTLAYRRRAAQANPGWSSQNQQAECLYMILAAMQDGTRNGLDFFRDSEIGDTDGDGMPEILDGWGRPIRFLRWAPGYVSPLQSRADLQPDPFDVLKVDPRWKNNSTSDRHYPSDRGYSAPGDPTLDDPMQLFPLVFSAGPDGKYNVVLDIYDINRVTTVNGYNVLPDDGDDYDPATGAYNGIAPGPGPAEQVHYRRTNDPAYGAYTPPIANYPNPVWPTNDLDGPGANMFPLWPQAPRNDPYLILPGAAVSEALGGNGVGVLIGSTYGEGALDNIDNQALVVR